MPLVAVLLFVTFLLGCGPGPVTTPSTWALSVAKAGDGSGEISSDPLHVLYCGEACFTNVERGAEVTLYAEPAADSTFEGWFDGCSGTDPCKLKVNSDTQPRGPRRVEDLIEQDTVWSVDPATGERFASHLIAIARASREVMSISGADFSLTCTTDHPLYDPSTKSWAPAGDWVLGQRSELLLLTDDGAHRVVSVQHRERSAGVSEVFDLSVEHELHNFVAAGVLVHNKKPPPRYPRSCPVDQPDGSVLLRHGVDGCSQPDGGHGRVDCDSDSTGSGSCLPLDE